MKELLRNATLSHYRLVSKIGAGRMGEVYRAEDIELERQVALKVQLAKSPGALEIDDSMGEAHASLGLVNSLLWNWVEAEKEFKRGIELNPNYATAHQWYGNQLVVLGRFDEALAKYKRAQELEPLSLIVSANLAEGYLAKGDLNSAFEQCQLAIPMSNIFRTE